MPAVAELVKGRDDQIDYRQVAKRYPWLFERNQDCIVSPDSDGLLCALFMSHHLGWKVRGFYDGKAMVADHRVTPSNCIFLDMELFRAGVRSVGQHMLLYNRNQIPERWGQFRDSFAINNFRGHDGLHEFQLKYPFGTIHVLLVALAAQMEVEMDDRAVAPLLFTDGTYNNLFSYTENSLNWLHYLRLDEPGNPLANIMSRDRYTLTQLMGHMNEFWRARDEISIRGERGDRIAISIRGDQATTHNLTQDGSHFRLSDNARARGERFIRLLSDHTGWSYSSVDWSWAGWIPTVFSKGSLSIGGIRLNGPNYRTLIERNPLSFAMTAGNTLEFTLDPDGLFR